MEDLVIHSLEVIRTGQAPNGAYPSLHWEKSEASLEDVFIELMSRARDNYQ